MTIHAPTPSKAVSQLVGENNDTSQHHNTSEFWVYRTSKHNTPPFKITGFEQFEFPVDYAINNAECIVRVAPFPKLTGQEGRGFFITHGGNLEVATGEIINAIDLPLLVVVTPVGDGDGRDGANVAAGFVHFTINHFTQNLGLQRERPKLGDMRLGFWVSHAGLLMIGKGAVTRIIENAEFMLVDHPQLGSFL
ncbi:hypothetical protein BJX64DRAFT_283169 [Aspergillus heterothallicus]